MILEKSQGWRDGIPIICVIGMEGITSITKDISDIEDEGTMRKFFNFCVYCSDHRLCHIVIVTNYNFSNDILDKCNHSFLILKIKFLKRSSMVYKKRSFGYSLYR